MRRVSVVTVGYDTSGHVSLDAIRAVRCARPTSETHLTDGYRPGYHFTIR
jgi:hypothetical protein